MESADDLLIDIAILRQKNEHLLRDNSLLRHELALAQTSIDHNSVNFRLNNEYEASIKSLSDEMRSCRHRNTRMNLRALSLSEVIKNEKFHIITLKTFVETAVSDMNASMKTSFTMLLLKYHDMIVKKDKQREDEVNKKDVELKSKIGALLQQISQLEQETEGERVIMQRRIETITRQVHNLETTHATEMKSRDNDYHQKIKDLEHDVADSLSRGSALEASNVELVARLQACAIEQTESNERLISNARELDSVKVKNVDLQSQLRHSRAQFDQMAATNDALQADLSSMLQRERSLQNEVGVTSLDKNEMQLRLHSIQAKVRTLEAEHAEHNAEMTLLQEQIEANVREKDMVTLQKAQISLINTELSSRIDELERTVTKMKHDAADTERTNEQKIEKATKESVNLKRNVAELEASVAALRMDRDAALSKAQTLESAQKDQKVKQQAENQVLQGKIDLLTMRMSQSGDTKKSLQLAQQTAAEREEEVFRLKETIRRECEERTEKMHEINMLKEKLLRFAEMQSSLEFGQDISIPHIKQSASSSFSGNSSIDNSSDGAAWMTHMRSKKVPRVRKGPEYRDTF